MGVANSGANIIQIIRASPGQNVKAGVSSIYSIKLTSSYFPISFIVNFQICWCAPHNMTHISTENILDTSSQPRSGPLASIRSGDDGKKLIALQFIDPLAMALISEYSYLNFGHYSLSPTDSLDLNI